MAIGVLVCDHVSDDLAARWGEYPAKLARLLRPEGSGAAGSGPALRIFEAIRGKLPPSVNVCGGWIVTGSRHAVYEDLPWIAPLEAFLREAHAARVPIVGICFGHQILAEALGGKVERSPRGWGIGRHTYWKNGALSWPADAPEEISCLVLHQDQILVPAQGAHRLYRSAFCPYAALSYGDPASPQAFSIQSHPEFLPGYLEELIIRRADRYGPERTRAALESLGEPVDAALIGRWMRACLLGARSLAKREGVTPRASA